MDESGEQFVAYFLPVEETLNKRREDFANNIPYQDDEEYEYKMAREYNWNVKSKASKGTNISTFKVVPIKLIVRMFQVMKKTTSLLSAMMEFTTMSWKLE